MAEEQKGKTVSREQRPAVKGSANKEKKNEEKAQANTFPSRLYRSEEDKVFGGVAAGLGEYFRIDPTIVRLIFVLFAFINGSGILIYLVLWLVLPLKSKVTNSQAVTKQTIQDNLNEVRDRVSGLAQNMGVEKNNNSRTVLGILLLIIGVIILFDNLGFRIWFDIGKFWPLLLIIIGFYLVSRK